MVNAKMGAKITFPMVSPNVEQERARPHLPENHLETAALLARPRNSARPSAPMLAYKIQNCQTWVMNIINNMPTPATMEPQSITALDPQPVDDPANARCGNDAASDRRRGSTDHLAQCLAHGVMHRLGRPAGAGPSRRIPTFLKGRSSK